MRWNHQTILDEIRHLHNAGEELCFSCAEAAYPHVVRAALWHFGSWKMAVEVAGYDYQSVSKYRRWTREALLEAIRQHHLAGHDLSWRSVSTIIDPSLAAAARRPGSGFASWRDALQAAGVNPNQVARYRRWTSESIVAEILDLAQNGDGLSAKQVQREHQNLYCAALRRFPSWNAALNAAGIEAPTTKTHRRIPNGSEKRVTAATPPRMSPQRTSQLPIALCVEKFAPQKVIDSLVAPNSRLDLQKIEIQTSKPAMNWENDLSPTLGY